MLRRQVVLDLSVALGAYTALRASTELFAASWKLQKMRAQFGEAWLTVNCRSWCDRWLRLVVRYVLTNPPNIAAHHMLRNSQHQTYFSKATTSPLSVTAMLSTRSSRTSVPQLLARNKRLPITNKHLLCFENARMYRGLLELGPSVS